VSYMTYFSENISLEMWSLWPLMMSALDDWAIDFFENILVPLDNYISRSTEHFLTCKDPDYQQSLFKVLSSVMTDKNIEDHDIESAPKLIEAVLQNCKGRVDQWVEPYLRITIERLRRTEKKYLKDLLIEVIANAFYYNPHLTLNILQKLGVATEVFNLWFHMLQEVKKSGQKTNFRREHDKKVCILGLTSLLSLPSELLPEESLGQIFRAVLDLLVAYKEQVAETTKDNEDEDDDMDGWKTDDDEEEEDDSDKEMGVDTEDGDEADSQRLHRLAAQAKAFQVHAGDEDDDSDDDFSDDEEFQSPIDNVDSFVFFSETMKVMSVSDPRRFQNLTQSMDFHYQAVANAVARHAEERRVEIEKEKAEKAASVVAQQ